MAQIYASEFTEQELKDLVTFDKSPLGQKLLAGEPISTAPPMGAKARPCPDYFSGQEFVTRHSTEADEDGSSDGTQNGPERSRRHAGAANLGGCLPGLGFQAIRRVKS